MYRGVADFWNPKNLQEKVDMGIIFRGKPHAVMIFWHSPGVIEV